MPILSTRLRHRVDFEELTTEQDSETGAVSEVWMPILTDVPADIIPLSGREFIAAQSIQSGITARIVCRYPLPGVKPSGRIKHGDDIYNIKVILPDRTLRRHLSIMCESGVNDG
jgi:SPP1 family predicted phage head-tail adaptor